MVEWILVATLTALSFVALTDTQTGSGTESQDPIVQTDDCCPGPPPPPPPCRDGNC